MWPLLAMLAGAIVRTDAPLRAACDAESEVVATVAAGTPAQLKFAFAGSEPCYKVVISTGGRTLSGYLRQTDLDHLEDFEQSRQQATPMRALVTRATESVALRSGGSAQLRGAIEALNANEPGRALALVESDAKGSRDANLLAIAGIAAWRNDEPRAAVDFWKRSLAIAADPALERLCARVEREVAADHSSGRIVGMHVLLRYEPDVVNAETARAMSLALDTEFSRISSVVGCGSPERIVAIVQTRKAYLAASGAEEWSGGQYDGRIRVALMDANGVGPETRRAFAHELTHACLSNLGHLPAWLHEGMAQHLSGDRLSQPAQDRIAAAIAARRLPKLESLNFHVAEDEQATLMYGLSLRAVNLMFERHAAMGIRNLLVSETLRSGVTAELNRELGL